MKWNKYSAKHFLFTYVFMLIFSMGISGCDSADPDVKLEQDPGLKNHTIYRPKDLEGLEEKLPIVVWGAGGCISPGFAYNDFLSEIASKHYLVIASNGIFQTRLSNPDMLIEAIDWAISENSRPESKYFGKINTEKVASMGQSCGGLEALHAGADPRVTTVVAWNSGIFDTGSLGGATKDDLLTLHTPTMWVNSGPKDIAYAQAEKDYAAVPDYVPAVWANYDLSENGTGVTGAHLGTFFEEKGGEFGRVAILWLDYLLKGVEENKAEFVGPDCPLCAYDPKWTVQYKNW